MIKKEITVAFPLFPSLPTEKYCFMKSLGNFVAGLKSSLKGLVLYSQNISLDVLYVKQKYVAV